MLFSWGTDKLYSYNTLSVGIDWADQKQAWCLQAADTTQRENGEVEHTPEAIAAWAGQLCRRFENLPIAVEVEQVKGALVFMHSKHGCFHLFPVPPTMSAKMREALYRGEAAGAGCNLHRLPRGGREFVLDNPLSQDQ